MFDRIKSIFKEEKEEKGQTKESKLDQTGKEKKNDRNLRAKTQKKDHDKKNLDKKNQKKQAEKHSPSQKTGSAEPKERKESKADDKDDKGRDKEDAKEQVHNQDEELNWPNKVKAIVIVELMGAPEEHIKNTMQLYLERIKENKDMSVEDEHLAPIEKKESFFLQFAELTITFKSVKNLIEFCFDYMPSSLEIIEPAHITYGSQDLSDIVNDLQAKLHQLDMIVKTLRTENKVLNDNGNLLLRNLILVALKEEMTLDSLIKSTGINKDAVEKFVESLIEGKLVEEKKGKYKTTSLARK